MIRFFISLLLIISFGAPAFGQSKMDLEDLDIKGELLNDDRLQLLARERNKLKNYVKYRTNYRKEITEGLKRPKPKLKYEQY